MPLPQFMAGVVEAGFTLAGTRAHVAVVDAGSHAYTLEVRW